MKEDTQNVRIVSRRTILRRLGVGTALVGGGVAGFSSGAAASHEGEPKIDIPESQPARDHPRFNAVIQINSAYLPDGGYIIVSKAESEDKRGVINGQSIIELPAWHFRNSSIVVQEAPDEGTYRERATISRDQAGKDPYEGKNATHTGDVTF